jgi:hypothetical protein
MHAKVSLCVYAPARVLRNPLQPGIALCSRRQTTGQKWREPATTRQISICSEEMDVLMLLSVHGCNVSIVCVR